MEEKLSLHKLFSNSRYFNIPYSTGETRTYPWCVLDDIINCTEEKEWLSRLRFPDEEQSKRFDVLVDRIPKLEDEYMKLTRFAPSEFLDALAKTTHEKWMFSHYQSFNEETKQWQMNLRVRKEKGHEGITYAVVGMRDKILNYNDLQEVREKLSTYENGTREGKEKFDLAIKYFVDGDPQMSYKYAKNLNWKPATVALRQHLCSHYVDMEIYNSFGPSKAKVNTPDLSIFRDK